MNKSKAVRNYLKLQITPQQTADQLFDMNFSAARYEREVQANRKRCLETFRKYDIKFLIEMQEELIAFGEEVIKILKEKQVRRILNSFHDYIKNINTIRTGS